jgi:hypothetical protein
MIGKVVRGNNARRLLYYLCTGRANEHTDPYLVAGFADPADPQPERRADGSRNFRSWVRQPGVALLGPGRAGGPTAVGRGMGAGRRRCHVSAIMKLGSGSISGNGYQE